MPVVRNVKVKLTVADDDRLHLDETFEQFRVAAQHVSDYGWADDPSKIIDRKGTLHDATYEAVRERGTSRGGWSSAGTRLALDAQTVRLR